MWKYIYINKENSKWGWDESCWCGVFLRLHKEIIIKKKLRFLSSVALLFLNNNQSIVLFWCCLGGLNTCYFLPLLSPSLSPSTSYSQSAVCALACVITTLPHWGLPLLHVSVRVRGGARVLWCVCVCVLLEVLLGAVRGLSSTLGFNGSPHHCSASSYLLPCRRAVASSRWLIREAGNASQIPNHPYVHTNTRMQTHSGVWIYVSIWARGSGAHKGKVCLGTQWVFIALSFVLMMQK